ncbi:Voltage-gated potassium channel subunit beta-2 [Phytophthora boehmeriae]|uniref:Voltage-gated potassium channel subunit beta-2 n=1 Tax=Phytophthora boehmeriae TaxID=109152 RepID=A0A8T1WBW1_9STRA|nr:Voltage-gated potassium channel subunit beta-2 [Phytophthora boehmeriae]
MFQKGGPLAEKFEERAATADKYVPIVKELEENLKALEFVDKITPEVKAKIDAVVNFVPKVSEMDPFALVRGRYL